MDKLKMHTPNKADENFKKLAEMFPNAVTETINDDGEVVRSIDKDVLMQEINTTVVDGKDERYQFTWPDKKKAVLAANAPISKTLRPCREESVDFDNTENLYIEGDNLEVLKLLQETYLGKVKMIYIDPPYNTGNDFVYNDNFAESAEEYLERSGQFDEDGNRLFQNTESRGRFHTDWLNMIYPRLKLAKDLLTNNGVIFISIDDNEQENLKKICNEIFGERNFVATFPWRKRTAKSDVPFGVSQDYEWIICYAKSDNFIAGIEGNERKYYETPDFPNCPWRIHDLTKQTTASERPNSFFTIVNPETGDEYPANPNRTWAVTQETFEEYYTADRIIFPGDYDFLNISKPVLRYWKEDDMKKSGNMFGMIAVTTKLPNDVGMSLDGTKEITKIFDRKLFSFPKTVKLLKHLIDISTKQDENAIILDFFSGSATTAHAVISLNAEDGRHRKFIMVQLPEKTDENSEAYKAGYENICEIGKERIRRAGKRIYQSYLDSGQERRDIAKSKKENPEQLMWHSKAYWEDSPEYKENNKKIADSIDIGFRVLKLDSTNMKDVYYTPVEFEPSLLDSLSDNIKEDRTPEDLLFQVMLDLGILLSSKTEQSEIAGKKIFNVGNNRLIACFDENVNEEIITAVAKQKPDYFVMRDSSMASDSVAANFEQIFAAYSPNTIRKVL